jgi:hypothetical protein
MDATEKKASRSVHFSEDDSSLVTATYGPEDPWFTGNLTASICPLTLWLSGNQFAGKFPAGNLSFARPTIKVHFAQSTSKIGFLMETKITSCYVTGGTHITDRLLN